MKIRFKSYFDHSSFDKSRLYFVHIFSLIPVVM